MHPTYRPDAPRSPELAGFADVMRSVLHTRPDSPVAEPHALEQWTDVDGYLWQWSTRRGPWTVAAGAVLDPRPRLSGPAGNWTVERYDTDAARELVALLRLAGALPRATAADHGLAGPPGQPAVAYPGPYAVRVAPDPPRAETHGQQHPAPPPARALYWRPGTDPFPDECADPPRPGDRYVAVALVAGARRGFQAALLPDGSAATLAAGQPYVLPLLSANGVTMNVQLDPVPDELGPDQPDEATAAAVIQAHRAAAEQPAPHADDPDADLALGPDDPAIAAAEAAAAAAGVPRPDPTNFAEFADRRAAGETFPGQARADELGSAIAAGEPSRAVGTAQVPGVLSGLDAIAAGASDAMHPGWRPLTGNPDLSPPVMPGPPAYDPGPPAYDPGPPAYDPPPTGGTTGGYGGE